MSPFFKNLLKDCDALLISTRPNIVYLTGYTNFSETERECFLLITKTKQYLITDKRYSEAVKEIVKDFNVIDSGAIHFITNDAAKFFKQKKIKTIGFEDYDLTVSEYLKLKKLVKTKPIDLRNLRVIKQKHEIESIKKACKIGDLAFEFILRELKLGISEHEVLDKLETFINLKAADISFKPIVAFGKNSSIPHHMSGNTKLKQNQIVLLDFGVKINNYCSDMTRTVFFGRAPEKFKKMHKTVLEAQQKSIQYINSQLLARDIDKVARDYITSNNYPTIPHSLGHGVGIEVHEPPHLSPTSKDKIRKGMIFSIEPGIYFPKYGGVRIEDLVLVTQKGAQLISRARREIIEL